MRALIDFSILQEYNDEVEPRGDKLSALAALVDWKGFLPIAEGMFKNTGERGGRPNISVIIMIKLLILQQLYGLSDPQLELQVADRISFRVFLGTTEVIPDYTTVWLFRERLIENGKLESIWEEFLDQLKAEGYEVKKGVIQDATFITSDPGHAKSDVPRGDKANTRRSKDGAWSKKGNKSYFGYKGHVIVDTENNFIWNVETTIANVHDSRVDLANEGEVRYGDKGYHGAKTKGYDASMKRAARGHRLSVFDELRNKRISSKRSPVERCFSVMKIVFRAGHVMVTTVERTSVKMTFNAIGYNLYNLLGLVNKKSA
ncbi:MAG: IS5 family transposase [Sedimentisphaerales bacterium]